MKNYECPKTVLVVEDEPPMLEALSLKLESEGFSVLKAADGKEGLRLALDKHPDLILLDVLLPKMNGMDVMRALRKDTWGKTALIILLTNLAADDKITKQISQDQPAFYLVKADWKLEDVMHKVKQTLKM